MFSKINISLNIRIKYTIRFSILKVSLPKKFVCLKNLPKIFRQLNFLHSIFFQDSEPILYSYVKISECIIYLSNKYWIPPLLFNYFTHSRPKAVILVQSALYKNLLLFHFINKCSFFYLK